ncbi:sensor histidine kinase [Streptomyces boninensis]|uniref:sensor histidine kinase n=1 Tax=Streptomyces boninensis TaxID=2039455 RepID=UPI003B20E9CF
MRRLPARRRLSLRARLVLSAVALIAVVCAVIGAVTTLALRAYLYDQLDDQVAGIAHRAVPPMPAPPLKGEERDHGPLGFLLGPGQPPRTLGAELSGGKVTGAAVSTEDGDLDRLDGEQSAALSGVRTGADPSTVSVGGLGPYRVVAVAGEEKGESIVVGVPESGLHDTIDTLIVADASVTAAGLAAAALAGTGMVRIALRPLRRVGATATTVARLPLDRGEVALLERVPAADTDPRTEVGQVGAALNRLLGHVSSALEARHESETRVRQFVADASHELRTPLASICGYAELTRRGREEQGPDTRHALSRIESEATRMTGLVEDLLLLARLDAGRPLALAEVDLSPLVVDAVGDARAAGPAHSWRLELPDAPAVVRGDPGRLQQVLLNLLHNARVHTPAGTTVIGRVARAGGGAGVLLEVEDDGPGIPAGVLPHVFERFARGDASRHRMTGTGTGAGTGVGAPHGTGLGLAIVHAVVTAHGGSVTVESAPGRTVFRVVLPGATPAAYDSQLTHSDATRS